MGTGSIHSFIALQCSRVQLVVLVCKSLGSNQGRNAVSKNAVTKRVKVKIDGKANVESSLDEEVSMGWNKNRFTEETVFEVCLISQGVVVTWTE